MLKNICILIFRVDVHSDSDSEEDASCDKIGTNSDAEEDVNIVSKKVSSPHDTSEYPSLEVKKTSNKYLCQLLNHSDLKEHLIKEKVPWHVTKDANFAVDASSLENKRDISIDAWRWQLLKTYVTSSEDLSSFTKRNDRNKMRLVKRFYKCCDDDSLAKTIIAVYPVGAEATNQSDPFRDSEPVILISYHFREKKMIPPSRNSRVYPSVKGKLKNELSKGHCPKKATFAAESKSGGIETAPNKSWIPSCQQAYYLKKVEKKNTKSQDPLKELISKQKMEESIGESIVKRITMNDGSYIIVLHTDRMTDNIANFCCCENQSFKSIFATDFTFELGEYFVLISVYKNTSLYVKKTNRCPTMIGPAMISHKKDAKTMKIFYDSILSSCPGLGPHLKVIGSDGEKSIMNESCAAFPASVLLLCMRHAQQNIERKLIELKVPDKQKKRIKEDLFGSLVSKGLVYCADIDAFEEFASNILDAWATENDDRVDAFAEYFRRHKLNQFKYHVSRAAVSSAGIVDCPEFFYNNACEFMNRLVKDWQKREKLDVKEFVESFETLVKAQESDVTRAFLGIQSPFEVRPEFEAYKLDFNTEFGNLPEEDKKATLKALLNVIVDGDSYGAVKAYSVDTTSIERARSNLTKRLQSTFEPQPQEPPVTAAIPKFHSPQKAGPSPEVESTEKLQFLFKNSRPNIPESVILGSIQKGKAIFAENAVMKNLGSEDSFLVKSYAGGKPHIVTCSSTGKITCDDACVRYQQAGFCGHCIGVALKRRAVDVYAASRHRQEDRNSSQA